MTIVRLPLNAEKCIPFCDEFFKNSAMVIEGVKLENDKDKKKFESIFRQYGYDKDELIAYELTGMQMNELYSLSGDVAYADDYCFLIIPNYRNPQLNFALQGTYFDCIVQENTYDMLEAANNAE